MRRQTILGAVSALALIIAAAPVAAQEAQPLSPGRAIQGELADGDAAAPDDAYRYDDFQIAAHAGQRFEATMTAEDFDAYLEVFRDDAPDAILASDDDGAGDGTTNARLRFTASAAGTYVLRARTLSGLDGGAYGLTLSDRGAAPRPPRPGGIRLGQTVRGELGDRDAEGDDGVPYDAWAFRAREGERFAVGLDSDAFDPVVRVGRMEGAAFTELARNDDGADAGLNSRLIFTAPAAGEYVIRATPLSNAGQGAYSLSLEAGPPPLAAQDVVIGDTVSGELTPDDGKTEGGLSADAYRFSGREGQRVRIDMTASAFDTYLQLFDENHVSLAEDDDGGPEGTNSRITFTLPADGTYVVEARPFSQAAGAYSLKIEEVAPPPPPQALDFGATVEGGIDAASPRDDEDRGYKDYGFSGTEGQRVQAILRSGDFDTFLQISAGGDFSPLASDDDGLGEGTDSRLNFTLPSDGDYVLRVSPLSKDDDGLYAIQLIDRGPQPEAGSILIGATAHGTLSETDATAEDNSFYDAYRVTAKAGEKLVITMVSNEVDSFLIVGRVKDDDSFEVLGSDDDGLADAHAKLEWSAPDDGAYEIRAGSFQQGETGAYALTVDKQADD
jgi:hypothetical protein